MGQYVVDHVHAGLRLDRYVPSVCTDLSRSRAARLIDAGAITLNDRRAVASTNVQAGDRVDVAPLQQAGGLAPEAGDLDVLAELASVVAICKPAGLVMHPGAGRDSGTLAHRLLGRYPEVAAIGHPRRPGIVHRLDKDTSGVVVVARTLAAYAHLAELFARRAVEKTYLALVHGRPANLRGVVNAPIGRHPADPTRMAVTRSGRGATTAYEVLHSSGRTSLLSATPATGRTHQIRVHLAAIGHPLLGDGAYGGGARSAPRPMLHAWSLAYPDLDGTPRTFVAPIPSDFITVALQHGLSVPQPPRSAAPETGTTAGAPRAESPL